MVGVKTVADANSLAGHFDRYPDIPVVIPRDMAGILLEHEQPRTTLAACF